MEAALNSLAVLGNVFLAVLIADRSVALWNTLTSRGRVTAADAEFVELKAYVHGNIHELRDKMHGMQLSLEAKSAMLTERLARLEVKMDGHATSQTETLGRMLQLVEAQAFKAAPQQEAKKE